MQVLPPGANYGSPTMPLMLDRNWDWHWVIIMGYMLLVFAFCLAVCINEIVITPKQ